MHRIRHGRYMAGGTISISRKVGCYISSAVTLSEDEAMLKIEKIKDWFEQRDEPLQCPTRDELEAGMKKLGMSVEMW
jgi:hypothetical protein